MTHPYRQYAGHGLQVLIGGILYTMILISYSSLYQYHSKLLFSTSSFDESVFIDV